MPILLSNGYTQDHFIGYRKLQYNVNSYCFLKNSLILSSLTCEGLTRHYVVMHTDTLSNVIDVKNKREDYPG